MVFYCILGTSRKKTSSEKNASQSSKNRETDDIAAGNSHQFVPDTCPPTPQKSQLAKAKRKSDLVSRIKNYLFILHNIFKYIQFIYST